MKRRNRFVRQSFTVIRQLNTRQALILSLAVSFGLMTTGCLRRRRVVVIHDAYAPAAVAPAAPVGQVPPTGEAAQPAPEAPPAARIETPPPAPSPSHVWVEGYWVWNRAWIWRPGVWVLRPRPVVAWVPGHWVHRPGGWVWVGGYWR